MVQDIEIFVFRWIGAVDVREDHDFTHHLPFRLSVADLMGLYLAIPGHFPQALRGQLEHVIA